MPLGGKEALNRTLSATGACRSVREKQKGMRNKRQQKGKKTSEKCKCGYVLFPWVKITV